MGIEGGEFNRQGDESRHWPSGSIEYGVGGPEGLDDTKLDEVRFERMQEDSNISIATLEPSRLIDGLRKILEPLEDGDGSVAAYLERSIKNRMDRAFKDGAQSTGVLWFTTISLGDFERGIIASQAAPGSRLVLAYVPSVEYLLEISDIKRNAIKQEIISKFEEV